MTELCVKGLHKVFGSQPVLKGVDLTVPSGTLAAVLGPSGSGKTTLLRVIAGFERADQGTVTLDGRVVDDGRCYLPPEQRKIGYVPQEGSLFPHLTVAKNIGFGLPRNSRRGSQVTELLDMIGMTGLGHRYPHQLSGGQQQRVALARALAVKPTLVLLDEPFSSLDASLRASVRADVRAVLREAGATALLVTHDQDEALSLAGEVAVMQSGQIGQCDTPQDLYTRPADPALAHFLGDANLVKGVLNGRSVRTFLGDLTLDHTADRGSGPVDVLTLIRPEQVRLRKCNGNGHTGRAGLTGRVVDHEYYGHDAVVRIRPDVTEDDQILVARVMGAASYPAGASVGLSVEGPVMAWPVN